MKMLQRGFVYGLMLGSLNVFAMELYVKPQQLDLDTYVEHVRDWIDEIHLGINKDTCGRALKGTCASWYRNYMWFRHKEAIEDVTRKMQKIESYISSNISDSERMYVLEKLIVQHWLVGYLHQALVRDTFGALENVTGLTIDEKCNAICLYSGDSIVQKSVTRDASRLFFSKFTDKKLLDIMPRVVDDMHFTILYGDDVIQPNSLIMSDDSTYLQATDETNTQMIWEMRTGERVNPKKIELDVKWIRGHIGCDDKKNSLLDIYAHTFEPRYQVIDKGDNYCAFVASSNVKINPEFFPKKSGYDGKTIILFKRPQNLSYLCQKAFDNSYLRSDELRTLSQSNTFNAMSGFPKENLKRFIENRIEEINPKKSS